MMARHDVLDRKEVTIRACYPLGNASADVTEETKCAFEQAQVDKQMNK